MAHLRNTIEQCYEPGCTARECEALYSFRNELYGRYCKKHAAKALAARQRAEEEDFRSEGQR